MAWLCAGRRGRPKRWLGHVVNTYKKGYQMKISKSVISLFVVCAAAVLSGCASLPSPEAMKEATVNFQLPKLPEAGNAMVYVVRPGGMGGIIRFNVFVDDQEAQSEMGYTRGNQYIYFSVKPGDHKIYSKAENWADANVSVKAGDIVYIKQEPSMGIIMARNNISKIEDYEGKYHVKTLELGTIKKAEK